MEASTGIEPVYTDLQSRELLNEFNDVSSKKYQDISRTSGERDTAGTSRPNWLSEKENTGAAATAPGVKIAKKPRGSCGKNTALAGKNAMSLYGKDAHKRIAKAVGFALTIGTPAAWHNLSILLLARLSEAERAGLAYSALRSLDEDNAYSVASLAIFGVSKGEVAQ